MEGWVCIMWKWRGLGAEQDRLIEASSDCPPCRNTKLYNYSHKITFIRTKNQVITVPVFNFLSLKEATKRIGEAVLNCLYHLVFHPLAAVAWHRDRSVRLGEGEHRNFALELSAALLQWKAMSGRTQLTPMEGAFKQALARAEPPTQWSEPECWQAKVL